MISTSITDARPGSVRPDLDIIEAEQLVKDQVRLKYRELLQVGTMI